MEVTRARFGSLLEWALAAVCALAIAFLGALVVETLRTPRGLVRVNVEAAEQVGVPPALDPPAAIPPRAVSVPLILLNDGTALHVGDRESIISTKLTRAWQTGVDALERTATGNRITRAYDDGVRQFLLVFDPPAEATELRLTAIYLR
jgi:hypothetical protein